MPALLGYAPHARRWTAGASRPRATGSPVPSGLVPWRADVLREDGSRATAGMARMIAAALGGAWTHGHRLVLFAPEGAALAAGDAR